MCLSGFSTGQIVDASVAVAGRVFGAPLVAAWYRLSGHGDPVYARLARRLVEWNELGNLGVVVGATRPDDVATVRELTPGMPILAPGVGAQGGALESTVRAGFGPAPEGVLVNAGRSALWASDGPDYAQAVRMKVEEMRSAIEEARPD